MKKLQYRTAPGRRGSECKIGPYSNVNLKYGCTIDPFTSYRKPKRNRKRVRPSTDAISSWPEKTSKFLRKSTDSDRLRRDRLGLGLRRDRLGLGLRRDRLGLGLRRDRPGDGRMGKRAHAILEDSTFLTDSRVETEIACTRTVFFFFYHGKTWRSSDVTRQRSRESGKDS